MKVNYFDINQFRNFEKHCFMGVTATGKTMMMFHVMHQLNHLFAPVKNEFQHVHYINEDFDTEWKSTKETFYRLFPEKVNNDLLEQSPFSIYAYDRYARRYNCKNSNTLICFSNIQYLKNEKDVSYLYFTRYQDIFSLMWEQYFSDIFQNENDFRTFWNENTLDYDMILFDKKTYDAMIANKPEDIKIEDLDKTQFLFRIHCKNFEDLPKGKLPLEDLTAKE